MRSIGILVEEHRTIRVLLDCLGKLVANWNAGGGLDTGSAAELLALLECFADGSHQDKEERCLFPRLVTSAKEREARVLQRLVREHADDRVGFAALRAELSLAKTGDEETKLAFVRDADAYVRAQVIHMKAEDKVVLPMAERLLTFQDDDDLIHEFDQLDRAGPGGAKRVTERIMALRDRLGVRGSDRRGPHPRPHD
jgi:hemerythrin-like domain-containing protein